MDRVYVMQLVRSFQVGDLSRRQFLRRATAAVGSLAAANVLLAACQPVTAPGGGTVPPPVVDEEATEAQAAEGTMSGDSMSGMIEYPQLDSDEVLTGYLSRPEGDGPFPAVVVIQEWWGLNDHIKDVTDRFAAEGYVALAPDLYKGVVTTEPNEARKQVMELDREDAVKEIDSAAAFLLAQEDVSGDGVGSIGFCMGGALVLATALQSDNVAATVAFYGTPLEPDQAAGVTSPVQGHYGTNDNGIPVDAVETMGAALSDAGVENEIYIYDGAQHAFFNDTRESSYDADAAAQAWERTLAWFSTYLGSS